MDLKLVRLTEIRASDIIALHNTPGVLRHMPLADTTFDEAACRQWVRDKEQLWAAHGYGPWGLFINDKFAGWGGFQQEHGDADLALVLSPDHWGYGQRIVRHFIRQAFDEMGLTSITALLPPSRGQANGLRRLGFEADGSVQIGGEEFCRFRLQAPGWPEHP